MTDTQIKNAVRTLQNGGVIAYPTEAVYGLGCDPYNESAIKKLISIKARDKNKGLILIASDVEQLYTFIEPKQFDLQAEIKTQWPGPITWVLPCKKNVSPLLSGNRNTLAVRISAHPTARALCEKSNSCIVSTSANISQQAPALNAAQVQQYFLKQVDYIVDAPLGKEKTVSRIFDAQTGQQLR